MAICNLEFTASAYSLYKVTDNIALHYKNVIDITSKCNYVSMVTFFKSIKYIRQTNEIRIFLAGGAFHTEI